jgi:hypothetical protein
MDEGRHDPIQNAVRAAGLVCERADLTSFTGEVMSWAKTRISTADLVIADLSAANPNVYLEVGLAWGFGRRTILIARAGAELTFDVRGQRCLYYSKISELESSLTRELRNLV